MLKTRLNLRIAAAIVAFLAVSALFVFCDEDTNNDDDNAGNGKVTVTKVTIEKPASATIAIGGTLPLKATVEPEDASDKTVTWSTSKKEVATVSNAGVVTGVSAGKADIIATSKNGKTDKIEVTVSDNALLVNPGKPYSGEALGRWGWGAAASTTWINATTNVTTWGTMALAIGWEFKSNGIFERFQVGTGFAHGLNGVTQITGNFEVVNDEIRLTNRKSKWTSSDDPSRSTDWESDSNRTIWYQYNEEKNWLRINEPYYEGGSDNWDWFDKVE
jgi:hypothetical protein